MRKLVYEVEFTLFFLDWVVIMMDLGVVERNPVILFLWTIVYCDI